MTDRKNQHFVPRSYLKAFASDDAKRSICLIALRSNRFSETAPIKGQCQKAHFYGKDKVLEEAFGVPEGWYANSRQMAECGHTNKEILANLLFSWLLQFVRSERNVSEFIDRSNGIRDRLIEKHGPKESLLDYLGKPIDSAHAAKLMFLNFSSLMDSIRDLRCLIIRAPKDSFFITCDNPATYHNKFYQQKLQSTNFGVANSGVYLFLPLSPKIAFLSYDADVYTTLESDEMMHIKKIDVDTLNQMTISNANECVYFHTPALQNYTQRLISESVGSFAGQRYTMHQGHNMGFNKITGSRHDRTDASIASKSDRIIVQGFHGLARAHPSFLNYRLRPRYLDAGVLYGYVRLTEFSARRFGISTWV